MLEHTSDQPPVPADTLVRVDLGDGQPLIDRAGALYWGPGLGPDGEGRIQRYEPITPAVRPADRVAVRRRGAFAPQFTSTRAEPHPLIL